jgi:2,3-dihydroxybenzoate-AMP ligase
VVEGRDKDMINRGGEKISAEEVENLLYQVPGIAQVAAVSVPDDVLGERVCAVIVPAAGEAPGLADIAAALTAMEVARYKIPERLLTVGELPLTKVGKVDKKALREMARDTLARQDAPGARGLRWSHAPGCGRESPRARCRRTR